MTCKFPERGKIPLYMKNDYETISLGLELSKTSGFYENKIVIIKNTMELEYLYISENLISEIRDYSDFEIVNRKSAKLEFCNNNYISPFN
jgi:hypothetical protein